MLGTLLMFIPEEAYILFLLLGAVMVMCGFRKSGLGLIGMVLTLSCLEPVFDVFINLLPDWALLLMLVFFAISLLKLILGKEVFGFLAGSILFALLKAPFQIAGRIVRIMLKRHLI
ncbi:uncharacterized protein Dvar_51580 [Desulfosarcina variabilis str. Montpellier]|uniref:hypothetical protein n=1 Tax=Desulfosarcina variabilis TaxID=2300 RepID=UPI003AFAB147